MSGCGQRKGLLGYCKKESLHPGDHDNGKTTWPRTGTDREIYLKALAVEERILAEHRRLSELAERRERGEL
jgi:hypothetical protein